jgi:hypothetical protein
MPSRTEFVRDGLGHLIADRWLVVPPYQRPYAWEQEHVDEFWNDLASAKAESREYFVGAVVLTAGPDATWFVIDGQQRLATASLLLAAIRDELAAIDNPDLADYVDQRFLQSFDPTTAQVEPRLRVAPSDQGFYAARFMRRSSGSPESASQRRLLAAFDALRSAVSKIGAEEGDSAPATALKSWVDFLERSVLVIVVESPSDSDAFQVFESLNDRGAPLTIADLLKNYLMSVDPSHAGSLQGPWDDAVSNLGADTEPQDFVNFIRHYWSSVRGATRERDLFRSLLREVNSSTAAAELVGSLATASELYAAMLDPAHGHWAGHTDRTIAAVSTLRYFQLSQYFPLVLAAMESFEPDELEELLVALVSWSFRGIVFGGIGGGTTERSYAQAAVSIRKGKSSSVSDVFTQLRPIIPSDEDFRNAFETSSMSRLRVASYSLRSLERGLNGNDVPALEPYPGEARPAVIGHILPKHADPQEWPGFAPDEVSRYVNRVGNLILRQAGHSSSASSWEDRRGWAIEQGFRVNEDLLRFETWSADAVRHRQQEQAARAVSIWSRMG